MNTVSSSGGKSCRPSASPAPTLRRRGQLLDLREASRANPGEIGPASRRIGGSVPEWVGEGSAIGVDNRGCSEFYPAALDGDIPPLQMHLLVVHWA